MASPPENILPRIQALEDEKRALRRENALLKDRVSHLETRLERLFALVSAHLGIVEEPAGSAALEDSSPSLPPCEKPEAGGTREPPDAGEKSSAPAASSSNEGGTSCAPPPAVPESSPFGGVGAQDSFAQQQEEDMVSMGTEFHEDEFEVLGDLGSGNFSAVKLLRYKVSGELRAVKSVICDEHEGDAVDRDLDVLAGRKIPNVVTYFGFFMTGNRINLVLEYMDAGSFDTIIKRVPSGLPEEAVAVACHQLLLALQGMHDIHPRFIHRDIKPGNILANRKGQVKLSDFNTTRRKRSTVDKGDTFTGTLLYMSPERVRGESHDTSSDIWSFGLTLYELLTGTFPYKITDSTESMGFFKVMDSIVNMPSPSLEKSRFSEEACDFVKLCLNKDPSKRPTATSLLEHPFMAQVKEVSFLGDYLSEILPPPKF